MSRSRTRDYLNSNPRIVDLDLKDIVFGMLAKEKKVKVRGDFRRSWMSDDYFDLIVWYEPSNAIHGFQLCYGKPTSERALTWLKTSGFVHAKVDSGEDDPEANRTPILLPDGSFPATEVVRQFRQRSERLPKALRNFVLAKMKQFAARSSRRRSARL